ncbi:MAG: hypothetical protein GC155_14695 [Alphaproteobacteria bacterium]|nr:hypothetical protein [Alphaproteobacteria bacterium]
MSECCSTKSAPAPAAAKSSAGAKTNCPRCSQPGQPVARQTLKHQVKPQHLETVEADAFNFCRTATCEAVYFNGNGIVLTKADVRQRIGLKETEDPVPLCYCFGFTEKMVVEEIRATGHCTIPQRITAEVKAGNCACEIRNPQGSCCLGNVTAAVKRVTKVVKAEK